MPESSLSLRIALFVIGVAVVAGVYLWGVLRRKRSSWARYRASLRSRRRSLTKARFEPELTDEEPPFDEDETVGEPYEVVRIDKSVRLDELPAVTNAVVPPSPPTVQPDPAPHSKPAKKKKADQMAFSFDGEPAPSVAPAPAVAGPQIITLFLRPSKGQTFAGGKLVRALNGVGMRYGDMQIFHHFGAGELKTKQPLFSVANMFEPGSFELEKIEAFQTAGLALFMQLPAELDGAVAFELFLNTAQRLAEAMGGELLSDPRQSLDSLAIDKMRRLAARFSNEQR